MCVCVYVNGCVSAYSDIYVWLYISRLEEERRVDQGLKEDRK